MLPNLPKKRKHKEADITPAIAAWLLEYWPNDCVAEIKIKGQKPKPHQVIALRQVADGNFAYKLPDMGRKNPFDLVVLHKTDALVITCDGRECTIECLNTAEIMRIWV